MSKQYKAPQAYETEPRPFISLSPVISNQVKAIGYDETSKTLAVTFTRGEGLQHTEDPDHGENLAAA